MKACGSSGDDCTDGNTASGGGHTVPVALDSNATATAATATIDFSQAGMASDLAANDATAISGGVEMIYTLPTPLIVNASTSSMSANIDFDVDNIFTFDDTNNTMSPGFPGVTITLTAQ
jgi:hypothetical protein